MDRDPEASFEKKLRSIPIVKLLLIFAVTFSLASLPGALSTGFQLPSIQLGHAQSQACETHTASNTCSEFWYPAGPAMNTELGTIFTDESAEFSNILGASPSIDFTDWTLDPGSIPSATSRLDLRISSALAEKGYFEVQFLLANTFWGCNFDFGNSACGIQIRQGIAHLLDRGNFATTESALGGTGTAIDNPLPTNNGGLPSTNPCAWDTLGASGNPTGAQCQVGAAGGTAYRIGASTGAGGLSWLQAVGSADLAAAGQHFINGGVATGFNAATGQLTGVNTARAGFPVDFFVRSDNPPRFDLGNGLVSAICHLFTAVYTSAGCSPYLTKTPGPITGFQGFITNPTTTALTWHMYTAGYGGGAEFDSSLYFTYNSLFVSGNPTNQVAGRCSPQSVGTFSAANYMYLCNTTYDSLSNQMEFASCASQPGDPTPGQPFPTFANCPGGGLTAVSAGYQSEDQYGKGVYTLPIYQQKDQFVYLNGWSRAINNDGTGIPNFFTWLNAFNGAPAQAGTLRQGFKQGTKSVNPYIASTIWDFYVVGNVYDSLSVLNPMTAAQLLDWMTIASAKIPNNQLTYVPPGGACTTQGGTCTFTTMRYTLRSDLFGHDGNKVTAYDVAFSYLSMKATGAFAGGGTAPMLGITILSPTQFDVNLNGFGPFTTLSLGGISIQSGRYWSTVGASAWNTAVSSCTGTGASCFPGQYTLASTGTPPLVNCALTCTFAPSNLNIDSTKIGATYDPIAHGLLIGSSAWQCGSGASLGSGCTPGGVQNPQVGQSYTLTRFGTPFAPASSISGLYFRSNGNLALWIWSQDNGDFTHDFLNFGVVAACFGQPLGAAACIHFQHGIGAPTGGGSVGLNQVAIVNRFVGLNWVSPYTWGPTLNGIGATTPVLHEGIYTLNPASAVGCTAEYPTGGYDC